MFLYFTVLFNITKINILKIIVSEHLLGAKYFTYIIPFHLYNIPVRQGLFITSVSQRKRIEEGYKG